MTLCHLAYFLSYVPLLCCSSLPAFQTSDIFFSSCFSHFLLFLLFTLPSLPAFQTSLFLLFTLFLLFALPSLPAFQTSDIFFLVLLSDFRYPLLSLLGALLIIMTQQNDLASFIGSKHMHDVIAFFEKFPWVVPFV